MLFTLTCSCGRPHLPIELQLVSGPTAIDQLSRLVSGSADAPIIVIFDFNTHAMFGDRVLRALGTDRTGHAVVPVVLGTQQKPFEPDRAAVGQVLAAATPSPAWVVGVGSGAVNDLGKYVAFQLGARYVSVATAPSMDGYAAPISALLIDGVKVTYDTKRPDAIVADLSVLSGSPLPLIAAGFGDLLGKLTSLRDWEMAHVLLEEYWCSRISRQVEEVTVDVLNLAGDLVQRAPHAVQRLMEGLVTTGVSVSYVGNSRPTSGSEHLMSHFLEMWTLNHGVRPPLHGHAVGLATLLVSEIAQTIRRLGVNDIPASPKDQAERIEDVLGDLKLSAVPDNFGKTKFDPAATQLRLKRMRVVWPQVQVVLAKIPEPAKLEQALARLGCPTRFSALGVDPPLALATLRKARYLRERYTILDLAAEVGVLGAEAGRLVQAYA